MKSVYRNESYWNSLHAKEMSLCVVGYPELGTAFNTWQYRLRLKTFERLINQEVSNYEGMRVLDCAFGSGAYTQFWRGMGVKHYVGVDISEAAVKRAKKIFPSFSFHQSDLSKMDQDLHLNATPFDVVTAIDVLYHIVDDDECALAIKNMLTGVSETGVFVFSDILVDESIQTASHVKRRSTRFYRKILSDLGFTMMAIKPIFFTMGDPVPSTKKWKYYLCNMIWLPAQKVLRMLGHMPSIQNLFGNVFGLLLYAIDSVLQRAMDNTGVNLSLVVVKHREN